MLAFWIACPLERPTLQDGSRPRAPVDDAASTRRCITFSPTASPLWTSTLGDMTVSSRCSFLSHSSISLQVGKCSWTCRTSRPRTTACRSDGRTLSSDRTWSSSTKPPEKLSLSSSRCQPTLASLARSRKEVRYTALTKEMCTKHYIKLCSNCLIIRSSRIEYKKSRPTCWSRKQERKSHNQFC